MGRSCHRRWGSPRRVRTGEGLDVAVDSPANFPLCSRRCTHAECPPALHRIGTAAVQGMSGVARGARMCEPLRAEVRGVSLTVGGRGTTTAPSRLSHLLNSRLDRTAGVPGTAGWPCSALTVDRPPRGPPRRGDHRSQRRTPRPGERTTRKPALLEAFVGPELKRASELARWGRASLLQEPLRRTFVIRPSRRAEPSAGAPS